MKCRCWLTSSKKSQGGDGSSLLRSLACSLDSSARSLASPAPPAARRPPAAAQSHDSRDSVCAGINRERTPSPGPGPKEETSRVERREQKEQGGAAPRPGRGATLPHLTKERTRPAAAGKIESRTSTRGLEKLIGIYVIMARSFSGYVIRL